ncbi:hypothetical protein LTR97_010609 [Elasticomyces elasticus]|uniref:Protein kinase domain-containing protein n=1 Tax=Elasticomyces elasticus TaxID=574655 RepID=A0AAN7W391_9PEZI|nr:hypothetical protein LTR97_010609 [Elasticomyces elasticus]
MFNAVLSLLGLRGRNPTDIEALSPTTQRTRRPYGGQPVPLDASQDPTDSDFYDEWFDAINIVPASDGVSVLTFCPGFLSEDPNTHEVDYDEEMYPREEDINWVRRLRDTNRVYQHMFESESESTSSSHPRIVRYLGPTPTGYRLERLKPGPAYPRDLDPTTNDAVLALYQRWALQGLNALDYIHSKGIVLNAFTEDALWIREDLSLAVAGFPAAACATCVCRQEEWSNPWRAPFYGEVEPERFTEDLTECPKRDIFDWAVWVCTNMSGASPLRHGITTSRSSKEYYDELHEREKALKRGEFVNWPRLPDEMLGVVVVKALRGEYTTAAQALEESRDLVEACGRTLSDSHVDEIDGFVWDHEFTVKRRSEVCWNILAKGNGFGKDGDSVDTASQMSKRDPGEDY